MTKKFTKVLSFITAASLAVPAMALNAGAAEAKYVGDVNKDGKVSSEDATAILIDYAAVLSGDKSGIDTSLGDINHDNKVSSEDATYILVEYAKELLGESVNWEAVKSDDVMSTGSDQEKYSFLMEQNSVEALLSKHKNFSYDYSVFLNGSLANYLRAYRSKDAVYTELSLSDALYATKDLSLRYNADTERIEDYYMSSEDHSDVLEGNLYEEVIGETEWETVKSISVSDKAVDLVTEIKDREYVEYSFDVYNDVFSLEPGFVYEEGMSIVYNYSFDPKTYDGNYLSMNIKTKDGKEVKASEIRFTYDDTAFDPTLDGSKVADYFSAKKTGKKYSLTFVPETGKEVKASAEGREGIDLIPYNNGIVYSKLYWDKGFTEPYKGSGNKTNIDLYTPVKPSIPENLNKKDAASYLYAHNEIDNILKYNRNVMYNCTFFEGTNKEQKEQRYIDDDVIYVCSDQNVSGYADNETYVLKTDDGNSYEYFGTEETYEALRHDLLFSIYDFDAEDIADEDPENISYGRYYDDTYLSVVNKDEESLKTLLGTLSMITDGEVSYEYVEGMEYREVMEFDNATSEILSMDAYIAVPDGDYINISTVEYEYNTFEPDYEEGPLGNYFKADMSGVKYTVHINSGAEDEYSYSFEPRAGMEVIICDKEGYELYDLYRDPEFTQPFEGAKEGETEIELYVPPIDEMAELISRIENVNSSVNLLMDHNNYSVKETDLQDGVTRSEIKHYVDEEKIVLDSSDKAVCIYDDCMLKLQKEDNSLSKKYDLYSSLYYKTAYETEMEDLFGDKENVISVDEAEGRLTLVTENEDQSYILDAMNRYNYYSFSDYSISKLKTIAVVDAESYELVSVSRYFVKADGSEDLVNTMEYEYDGEVFDEKAAYPAMASYLTDEPKNSLTIHYAAGTEDEFDYIFPLISGLSFEISYSGKDLMLYSDAEYTEEYGTTVLPQDGDIEVYIPVITDSSGDEDGIYIRPER